MIVPATLREQQKRIEALCDRVEKTFRARDRFFGDRVYYPFIGEVVFAQGANAAQDIVFQVPEGCDYVAQRLAMYPSFRFVTTDEAANGTPEISFRPCTYTSTMQAILPDFQAERACVDAFIMMTETYKNSQGAFITRPLQDKPTPAQMLYSSAINYRPPEAVAVGGVGVPINYTCFQFPSAFVFPEEHPLLGGSSLTVKVVPSFAALRVDPVEPAADTTLQNEYKLTVVLEGYKVFPAGRRA